MKKTPVRYYLSANDETLWPGDFGQVQVLALQRVWPSLFLAIKPSHQMRTEQANSVIMQARVASRQ